MSRVVVGVVVGVVVFCFNTPHRGTYSVHLIFPCSSKWEEIGGKEREKENTVLIRLDIFLKQQ